MFVLWNVYQLCHEVEKGFKNTLTKTYTYWYTIVICIQIYCLKVLNLFVLHKLRTKENCLCSSVCSLYALLKNVKSIWNTISYFWSKYWFILSLRWHWRQMYCLLQLTTTGYCQSPKVTQVVTSRIWWHFFRVPSCLSQISQ